MWSGLWGVDSSVKTLDQSVLSEMVRRLVEALDPEAIYLYGSHAYGTPHEDSDVDLLIIVKESTLPPHRRSVAAYRATRGLFLPIEIRVVTRAEFERRARWHSSVERAALDKGKVLYGGIA